MIPLPTPLPIGAEPRQIEPTQAATDMGFGAARTQRAEATGVVWAGRGDGGGISVEVEAVGGVGAGERAAVVRAVGHASSRISYQHQLLAPPCSQFQLR